MMKYEPENSIVHLPRSGIKPPPTRLVQHTSSPKTGGAILLSQRKASVTAVTGGGTNLSRDAKSADLTVRSFSVTRARAHAQARASAHAYAHARKDEGALRRVIDAALSGSDVRVAAVKPASPLARFFAWLLIPAMLIAPLAPAYADEAPLADRVASDVAAIVGSSDAPSTSVADNTQPASAPESDVSSNVAAVAAPSVSSDVSQSAAPSSADAAAAQDTQTVNAADSPTSQDVQTAPTADANAGAPQSVAQGGGNDVAAITQSDPTPAPVASSATDSLPVVDSGSTTDKLASDTPTTETPASSSDASGTTQEVADPAPVTQPVSSGGGAALSDTSSSDSSTSSSEGAIETPPPVIIDTASSSTASTTIVVDETMQTETVASTTADGETPILDVAPDEVIGNIDAIRARLRNEMRGELRNEVRDEVKQEVRREVEQEVYRGCKNLDGTGYYCIPDAQSFGSPVIANERSISVVVQPDPSTGNKQIFLVRGASTIQLTHGTDDNVFPVLDPSGDTLVWQSMQNGKWQIAYAHVNDVGVPKVKYLTSGDNNFNPKVYGGRIAWQAWVDGNWEIFTAAPSPEKIPDDALSADHRAVGVNGDWLVKRITANNAPDMFPNVSGDTITWQAIEDGVWQVFAYDITTGVAHRVSKPGVKSESPRVALVWNEEDANGQMRMVGSSVDGAQTFDLTALARRLVDNTRNQPKTPVSNTEIVVATPPVIRTESDATSTPVVN